MQSVHEQRAAQLHDGWMKHQPSERRKGGMDWRRRRAVDHGAGWLPAQGALDELGSRLVISTRQMRKGDRIATRGEWSVAQRV